MSRTSRDRQPVRSHAPTSLTATALVGELAIRLANQVAESCAERGVVLMPLKGVLLLARWPVLRGRRDLVDIDLLVRPLDIPTIGQILGTLGFEQTVRTSAGSTFASDQWPLSIDVHRQLFPHGLFRADTDELFARAELDESLFAAPIAHMSDEDLFAHLIGHFVKGRGRFPGDKSLDDIRWLLTQGCFRAEDADRLGEHLRDLGLKRAAGYVLGHASLSGESVASGVVRSLALSRLDRAAIAAANLGTDSNAGAPLWWTPHLLDQSLAAGSRSLLAHASEGTHRLVARARSATD